MRSSGAWLIAVWLSAASTVSLAQDAFPVHSIEIVVPFGTGGGADAMARKLALLLKPEVGVTLSVTNIPGASGNAGLTRLLTRPADGYTLAVLISLTVSSWAAGIGYARLHDFAVLALPQQSVSMLFVPIDSGFTSFRGLLDYARVNPGRIRVATSGYGSNDDVVLNYFEALGYRMINVPYAKPEQRYAAPFAHRAHALYEQPGDVKHLLATRRLRPLVVFDTERHAGFRDVPSSKELGFEINDLLSFRMLVVRADTPPERQKALAAAIAKVLETPEWKKFCADTDTCTRPHTPEDATRRVQRFFETSRDYVKHLPARRTVGRP